MTGDGVSRLLFQLMGKIRPKVMCMGVGRTCVRGDGFPRALRAAKQVPLGCALGMTGQVAGTVDVRRGGALPRPPVFRCLFTFCLRRDTFFPWRKKVSKERHLRGEGFRFPSPLKNPLTLKRPKGRGCAPPLWKPHPRRVGDYQIAPLPRSGKGGWRPRAAG